MCWLPGAVKRLSGLSVVVVGARYALLASQVADGVLMASARAASKMEAQSAAAQARTPPNQNPRPVSRAVMLAASGARHGAGALAYVADKVR